MPVNGCEKLGIRPVCSRAQAERFLAELDSVVCGESKGWNQRYRENMRISVRASCVRLRRSSRAWPPGNAGAVCPRARKRCSHRPCRYSSPSWRSRLNARRAKSRRSCASISAAERTSDRKALRGQSLFRFYDLQGETKKCRLKIQVCRRSARSSWRPVLRAAWAERTSC